MQDVKLMPGRLESFLAASSAGRSCRVTDYRPLTGGYSRAMARAEVTWDDGFTEILVLRGDPPPDQALFVTDRDLEWDILRALTNAGAAPMPAARWYDSTGEHLGTKAIVLDWCDGPSLRSLIEDPADHDRHACDLVDTMAAVHAIDPAIFAGRLPLPTDWDEYMDGLIGQWVVAERTHPEAVPVLRYLGAWLDTHRPEPLPFVLNHGDFQASNILVTNGAHQVIDWEFAHIGDPREDLGYYNVYSSAAPPNLYERDAEAFLARYRERTGYPESAVNQLTVAYFTAVAAVKVYTGVLSAVGAMARGQSHGVLTMYNINAMSIGHNNFLGVCNGLDAAGFAMEVSQ